MFSVFEMDLVVESKDLLTHGFPAKRMGTLKVN